MERAELGSWLRLLQTPGLGMASARRLLAHAGTPKAVFEQPLTHWQGLLTPSQSTALAEPAEHLDELLARTWAWLQQGTSLQPGASRRVLTLGDRDYPDALLQTVDPPLLLYLQGRLDLLRQPALAIVGSRRPTPQGRESATSFAQALSQAGQTIVSGLALGVDGAAHKGALRGVASTIAVVGTGLDQIYPRSHHTLGCQILAQGLMISEYALGTPALAPNFPHRARIIAGLAQGCLVVEAAPKSHCLVTARRASEAGRKVFAIPGSNRSPHSRGGHALIPVGAKLVERARDVLEELRASQPIRPRATESSQTAGLSAEQSRVLELMGYDPVSLHTLLARGGWPQAELSAHLLELELAGTVVRLAGALFQRQRGA